MWSWGVGLTHRHYVVLRQANHRFGAMWNSTLLHVACECGALEAITTLINKGADPNGHNELDQATARAHARARAGTQGRTLTLTMTGQRVDTRTQHAPTHTHTQSCLRVRTMTRVRALAQTLAAQTQDVHGFVEAAHRLATPVVEATHLGRPLQRPQVCSGHAQSRDPALRRTATQKRGMPARRQLPCDGRLATPAL